MAGEVRHNGGGGRPQCGGRSATLGDRSATMGGQVGHDGGEAGWSAQVEMGVGVTVATAAPQGCCTRPLGHDCAGCEGK